MKCLQKLVLVVLLALAAIIAVGGAITMVHQAPVLLADGPIPPPLPPPPWGP